MTEKLLKHNTKTQQRGGEGTRDKLLNRREKQARRRQKHRLQIKGGIMFTIIMTIVTISLVATTIAELVVDDE